MSLGAARAGFVVSGAVEIDSEAMNAHKKNFLKTDHLAVDVSKLTGHNLRTSLNLRNGDLAGIIGGPPCQGFSHIGRNNKGDARNGLFVEFFRIVAETRPKFFLAENVPGIMGEKNRETRERAFSIIEKDYVLLSPMVLSANEYGAPTTRKRIFFFGYQKDEMSPLTPEDFMPPKGMEIVRVCDALKGLPTKIKPSWQSERDGWRPVRYVLNGYFGGRLHGHIPEEVGDMEAIERLKSKRLVSGFLGTVHSQEVSERYAKVGQGKRDYVSKAQRLDPNGFCPTLRAGTGRERGSYQAVRPLHPTENRVITPREAARLQGFPDWFQFSPTKWHSFRQIGNSVSPILAEFIMKVVFCKLQNV